MHSTRPGLVVQPGSRPSASVIKLFEREREESDLQHKLSTQAAEFTLFKGIKGIKRPIAGQLLSSVGPLCPVGPSGLEFSSSYSAE